MNADSVRAQREAAGLHADPGGAFAASVDLQRNCVGAYAGSRGVRSDSSRVQSDFSGGESSSSREEVSCFSEEGSSGQMEGFSGDAIAVISHLEGSAVVRFDDSFDRDAIRNQRNGACTWASARSVAPRSFLGTC